MKEESENVGLKLNIQKMKIMASGPITSWQIDVETVAYFILCNSLYARDLSFDPGSLIAAGRLGKTVRPL